MMAMGEDQNNSIIWFLLVWAFMWCKNYNLQVHQESKANVLAIS